MAITAGAELFQSKARSKQLCRVSHAGARFHPPLPSQVITRKLDGKWNCQDTNWRPYVMPEPTGGALAYQIHNYLLNVYFPLSERQSDEERWKLRQSLRPSPALTPQRLQQMQPGQAECRSGLSQSLPCEWQELKPRDTCSCITGCLSRRQDGKCSVDLNQHSHIGCERPKWRLDRLHHNTSPSQWFCCASYMYFK